MPFLISTTLGHRGALRMIPKGGLDMRNVVVSLVILAFVATAAPPGVAQEPAPAAGPAAEALQLWERMGNMLMEMAEDFPEEKYDFKPTPEVRSFKEQLLHVAGANYFFIRLAGGEKTKPAHPGRDTKADVVAVLKESYADGAALLRQTGDAGLSRTVKHPFAEQMISLQNLWMVAVGHGTEHYGQLVVYYRLNGLVPPTTRRQQQ